MGKIMRRPIDWRRPVSIIALTVISVVVVLALSSCVHLRPPASARYGAPAPDPACEGLERRVAGLHLAAIITGALGAVGAGIAPSFGDPAVKYSVAGAGGGLSLTAAIVGGLQGFYAARFVQKCTAPPR